MKKVALFALLLWAAAAAAADDTPWRRMAEQDLAAVHDTIAARHPGPVDPRNPAFAQWHERGYREALALAAKAVDFDGYEAALRYYVNGFHDGHLGLSLDMQATRVSWPGFVVARRDGAIRVHGVAPGTTSPRIGDALVACDGIAAEQLYAQRVQPYFGNPEIASSRVRFVPRLFVDSAGATTQLHTCTFRGTDGERSVDLAWRKLPVDQLAPMLRAASLGPAPALGVREAAANGTWLSLPSFSLQGSDIEAMKATLAKLPKHRDSAYVVVDVRGNGGGSSHWGQQAIRALYGDAWGAWLAKDAEYRDKDTYTDFRVSRKTAEHFRGELPRLAEGAGKASTDYRYFERIVADLDTAVARGDVLMDDRAAQRSVFGVPEPPGAAPKPAYAGRVYFLTDAGCASACLDFADLLLCAPNVVHVGQPTSGDTVYMDLAFRRLPSNAAGFAFATKVIRGRARGNNQAYVPQSEWTGDVWDTGAVEAWIAGLERKAPKPAPATHCANA